MSQNEWLEPDRRITTLRHINAALDSLKSIRRETTLMNATLHIARKLSPVITNLELAETIFKDPHTAAFEVLSSVVHASHALDDPLLDEEQKNSLDYARKQAHSALNEMVDNRDPV